MSLKLPIILLKTKSTPNDGYEEYFSSADSDFEPHFVPVLEHSQNDANLAQVKELLRNHQIGGQDAKYSGMIFTSQRAVEAFQRIVDELASEDSTSTVRPLAITCNAPQLANSTY